MISLYKANGDVHTEWFPKTASETFTINDLVYLSSGYLTKFADAVDQPPLGLIQKTVAATDDDYASTTKVPVQIGNENTEYLCTISTGTGAQSYVGTWCDVDDQNSIDVTANTYEVFFPTQHISTTQCLARMATNDPYQ